MSFLYKLFEKVILERLRQFSLASGTALSHPLQFAYKRQSCSLMTSFTLQETVKHFLKRSSVVYCCFLDAASAFDVVWHDGLLYKLYELGVNGKMWRILRNIYSNMNSCISLDGLMSDWFPIKQSVRQGGVLSAWLCIIYVNKLLVELEKRSLGTYIHNTFYGSPMQADDLALLSICKQDLDNMIKICYEYSIKWRYTLNPNKTVITVFKNSGKRPSKSERRRTWSLGDNTISEQAWYKHVGILLYSNLRTVERTLTACRKLRGTFVSIVGVGLHPHSMNPITGRKIYERIVLPSALYGCELWSDLTRTE